LVAVVIAELLFRVNPDDPVGSVTVTVAGDVCIEILAVDDTGEAKYAGTLHLTRAVAEILRGIIDRVIPQLWPELKLFWAGEPLASVAPMSGIDPMIRLAKKFKLLPTS
jgi:hypothetical protein